MKWIAVHGFSQKKIAFDVKVSSSASFEEQHEAARKALSKLIPGCFMDYVLTPVDE